jgi:HSP20 family molecular chaperone IbpA
VVSALLPKAEVSEADHQIAVEHEVPGLSERGCEITMKDHVLVVRGEGEFENGFEQQNLAWIERPCGTFAWGFNLPAAKWYSFLYLNGAEYPKSLSKQRLPVRYTFRNT